MNRKFWWIISGFVLAAGAGIAFFLCAFHRPMQQSATVERAARATNPLNIRMVDATVRMLKSGDIVLRTGADITSYMFTQMNRQNKTYSHCGIVVVEDGYPFIYHSIGGEDNPDQKLKRDSAGFWFSPANNLGHGVVRYDMTSIQCERLVQSTLRFFREQIPFDMDFDLNTDDRLYCAELVYKVVNEAMDNPEYIKASTMFGYAFVAIDNLFLHTHASFICQVRYK